jgi:hypothetical protein
MLVLAVAACGDDNENNGGGGGGEADAGTDTGLADGGEDAGEPDEGGEPDLVENEDTGEEECNEECPTALPSLGTGTPRIVFQSVRFGEENELVLKNLSGDDVNFEGWFICNRPTYVALPDFTLGAGDTVTVHLTEAGSDDGDNIFLDSSRLNVGARDELALYDSSSFSSSDSIVAYLRWGGPASAVSSTSTREEFAVDAGIWNEDDFVPVCGSNTGLIGVGLITRSGGWRDVPASCF